MSAWTAFDSWRAERDPAFVPKAVAVIGLQLHPPTDGPTCCIDEQTGSAPVAQSAETCEYNTA